MSAVKLLPELLPNFEKLVYKPTLFAAKGEAKAVLEKVKKDIIEVRTNTDLSFYGGIKIAEVETKSVWVFKDGIWHLSEYFEENKKNKTSKEWKKPTDKELLDPASLIFSLRNPDLFKNEAIEFNLFVGTKREVPIKFSIVDVEERIFTFLGNRPRRQIGFSVSSNQETHKKDFEYLKVADARVWLDRLSGIPTEMSLKVPIIGAIGIRLVDHRASN